MVIYPISYNSVHTDAHKKNMLKILKYTEIYGNISHFVFISVSTKPINHTNCSWKNTWSNQGKMNMEIMAKSGEEKD